MTIYFEDPELGLIPISDDDDPETAKQVNESIIDDKIDTIEAEENNN